MRDTEVTAGAGPLRATPPGLAGGRYALGTPLGQGGMGTVFAATDLRSGEEVAVKIVAAESPTTRTRLRRELAALRWLRMPGIVHLRDDGPVGEDWFIAMDRVEGLPFPGTARGWTTLQPLVVRLLEVLQRVHAAGIVHLDLKPANVLVRDGAPVVLDFGVAGGRALGGSRAHGFTARYAAPEQREGRGEIRSDLYAVGKMVLEALGRRRAPPTVRSLLRQMTAEHPDQRPPSAEAVLAVLRGPVPTVTIPQDLRELFVGPDLFWHLREDAAAVLGSRVDDRSGVPAELAAWVSSGQAARVGDQFRLDRVAIERLAEGWTIPGTVDVGGAAERLFEGALRGNAPTAHVASLAAAATDALRSGGRLTRAYAVAEVGAGLAPPDTARALLEQALLAALCQEASSTIDRALALLERSEADVEDLRTLARGALAAYRQEGARAMGILGELAGLTGELEIWRQGLLVRAASALDRDAEGQLLTSLEGWAGEDPARRAKLDGWWSNLRYREGRFREAAALRLSAAARKPNLDARLSGRLAAAEAWMEAGDFEDAARVAEAAFVDAEAARLPRLAAGASFVLRSTRYRAGEALEPRPDHVAALDPTWELTSRYALLEAAVAWRAGDPAAEPLATTAEAGFRRLGAFEPHALAEALLFSLRAQRPPPARVAQLASRRWTFPDLGAQAWALLHRGGVTGAAAEATSLAARVPPDEWRGRKDVLAMEECVSVS